MPRKTSKRHNIAERGRNQRRAGKLEGKKLTADERAVLRIAARKR